MAGLLGDVLPWAFSRGNALKRHVGGLLSDPIGSMQQTAGLLQDKHRENQQLNALAFADPSQPFKPTNQNALAALIDRTMNGPMGFAPVGMIVGPNGAISHKVSNLKGEKVPAPTKFYRGETPAADRVLTHDADWDRALFAADNPYAASLYGRDITEIQAKPGANIAYEGTKEFASLMKGYGNKGSMLDWASEASRRAREAGFDAVWFKRQSDLGTAILDRSKFDIHGNLINNTGGHR
jgi:hypothetical protein